VSDPWKWHAEPFGIGRPEWQIVRYSGGRVDPKFHGHNGSVVRVVYNPKNLPFGGQELYETEAEAAAKAKALNEEIKRDALRRSTSR
jgi:hypothetical protein